MDNPKHVLATMLSRKWPSRPSGSRNDLARLMLDSQDSTTADVLSAMQPPSQGPIARALGIDPTFRNRDTVLPFESGSFKPAWPQFLVDAANTADAVGSSPLLGAIPRDDATRERMTEMAGAVVGPMAAVGMGRAAMAPKGGAELGIFGGRIGAENLSAQGIHGPRRVLDQLPVWESQGLSREDIWALGAKELEGTPYAGPFRGVDQMPRFEIDDSRMPPPLPEWSKGQWGKSPEDAMGEGVFGPDAVVQHRELARAYPDMSETSVGVSPNKQQSGYFRPYSDEIEVLGPTTATARGSILHELQHKAQWGEGHAFGGHLEAPDFKVPAEYQRRLETAQRVLSDPARKSEHSFARSLINDVTRMIEIDRELAGFNYYKSLAGEVEARTTEARGNLSPDQRRARPPWLDYDVPEAQQIVRIVTDR